MTTYLHNGDRATRPRFRDVAGIRLADDLDSLSRDEIDATQRHNLWATLHAARQSSGVWRRFPGLAAFNAEATGEKFRDIATAFGVDVAELSTQEARAAAVDAVAALTRDLGNPTTLREIGAKEEDIPALAQAAFDDVCAGGNPRAASVAEIEELYRALY